MTKPKKPTLDQRVAFLEERMAAYPPSVMFGKLPVTEMRDRLWPIMVLARAHHIANPNLEEDDGWACIYDEQENFLWSLPRDLIPAGSTLMSFELVDNRVRELHQQIKNAARRASAELGEFKITRRQGRLFIKHVGVIPVAGQGGYAQPPG